MCRQNCIRRFRQWSFCRLIAIRISQVIALESPRKLPQFRCAFRKHSCVSVSARSTSRVDASKKPENLRPVGLDHARKLFRGSLHLLPGKLLCRCRA